MNVKLRSTTLSTVAMLLILTFVPLASAAAQSVFMVNRHLYSETANANADIAAAMVTARREHKRILLDFGANWCGDCQVLDFYYRQSPNVELLAKHFLVVHIDTGHVDHNVDVAKKYHVPIAHGIPSLAVIDAHGNLLYAEREKEFEHTSVEAVTAFLNRWKG
ncbi:thioredoxin family protein [Granulicella sp. S190]|uniref:thioredoxin family protein n=1 Tax=Granulicella sp. S190 TaxID=1747226 RepID=UPI00131BF86F|nr:thioredoxin family protein [Granulicella sp. S190]